MDINFLKVVLGEKIDSCIQQFIPSTSKQNKQTLLSFYCIVNIMIQYNFDFHGVSKGLRGALSNGVNHFFLILIFALLKMWCVKLSRENLSASNHPGRRYQIKYQKGLFQMGFN